MGKGTKPPLQILDPTLLLLVHPRYSKTGGRQHVTAVLLNKQ